MWNSSVSVGIRIVGGYLIPDMAKHAVVPTQPVDRGSSISGNCSKYSNYFIWPENNFYPFSDSPFI